MKKMNEDTKEFIAVAFIFIWFISMFVLMAFRINDLNKRLEKIEEIHEIKEK